MYRELEFFVHEQYVYVKLVRMYMSCLYSSVFRSLTAPKYKDRKPELSVTRDV